MKIRKIITVGLPLLLTMCAVSGCGQQDPEETEPVQAITQVAEPEKEVILVDIEKENPFYNLLEDYAINWEAYGNPFHAITVFQVGTEGFVPVLDEGYAFQDMFLEKYSLIKIVNNNSSNAEITEDGSVKFSFTSGDLNFGILKNKSTYYAAFPVISSAISNDVTGEYFTIYSAVPLSDILEDVEMATEDFLELTQKWVDGEDAFEDLRDLFTLFCQIPGDWYSFSKSPTLYGEDGLLPKEYVASVKAEYEEKEKMEFEKIKTDAAFKGELEIVTIQTPYPCEEELSEKELNELDIPGEPGAFGMQWVEDEYFTGYLFTQYVIKDTGEQIFPIKQTDELTKQVEQEILDILKEFGVIMDTLSKEAIDSLAPQQQEVLINSILSLSVRFQGENGSQFVMGTMIINTNQTFVTVTDLESAKENIADRIRSVFTEQ